MGICIQRSGVGKGTGPRSERAAVRAAGEEARGWGAVPELPAVSSSLPQPNRLHVCPHRREPAAEAQPSEGLSGA